MRRMLRISGLTIGLAAVVAIVALAFSLGFARANAASSPVSFFGDAGYNASGAQLASVGTVSPYYGGIDFAMPAGTTLGSLSNIAATFQMTSGDCAGGAPRFTAYLSNGHQVNLYFGPAPDYTSCGTAVQPTSNLTLLAVDATPEGGTFYDTWAHAVSLAGSTTVTDIAVIVDGEWAVAGNSQIVELSNVTLGNTTYNLAPPTSKDQCKGNGWQTFPGRFKNQGDCVSFVETGK